MFKKYGKFLILIALLLLVTEVTSFVNRKVDSSLSNRESDQTLVALRGAVEHSDASSKGLNPYQEFWIEEITKFKREFPENTPQFFDYQDKQIFESTLAEIEQEVSTTYVTNKDLIKKVKTVIPDNFLADVFSESRDEGYFRSLLILMEDDYNLEQEQKEEQKEEQK